MDNKKIQLVLNNYTDNIKNSINTLVNTFQRIDNKNAMILAQDDIVNIFKKYKALTTEIDTIQLHILENYVNHKTSEDMTEINNNKKYENAYKIFLPLLAAYMADQPD